MPIEVEQKYRVHSHGTLRDQLIARGARADHPASQLDVYYAHPQRDFAATDEALRIRRVGQTNCITYKGPKLSMATKTRQEIELTIAPGDEGAACGSAILAALGFRQVAEVRKHRQCYHLGYGEWMVEVALDEVAELGLSCEMGLFVEFEIIVDQQQVDPAEQAITQLADELGLSQVERSSYLELLLCRRDG